MERPQGWPLIVLAGDELQVTGDQNEKRQGAVISICQMASIGDQLHVVCKEVIYNNFKVVYCLQFVPSPKGFEHCSLFIVNHINLSQ